MQRTIASGPDLLGRPLEGPASVLTGLVYGSIRGVTQIVGAGLDAALAQLAPLLGESVPGTERAAVLAALNGVLGDYLLACVFRNGSFANPANWFMSRGGIEPPTRCLKGSCSATELPARR